MALDRKSCTNREHFEKEGQGSAERGILRDKAIKVSLTKELFRVELEKFSDGNILSLIFAYKLFICNNLVQSSIFFINEHLRWSIGVVTHPEFSEGLLFDVLGGSFTGVDLADKGFGAEFAPGVVLRFAV